MVDLSSTFPALESIVTQAQHSESEVRGVQRESCVFLGSLAPASFPQCSSDLDSGDIHVLGSEPKHSCC